MKTMILPILITLLVSQGGILNKTIIAQENTPERDDITLDQSIEWVLSRNLTLKAAADRIKAKEARVLQAGAWQNPELSVESENLYGKGAAKNFDAAETTIKVNKSIDLFGQNSKQVSIAKSEWALEENQFQINRSKILSQTIGAFANLVQAQAGVSLEHEKLKTNEQLLLAIKKLVEAGRLSITEQKRAKIGVSQSQISLMKARQAHNNAKNDLSLLWGEEQALFYQATGNFTELNDLPSLNNLKQHLPNSFVIKEKQIEQDLAISKRELAQATIVQAPTLSGGVKNDKGATTQTWVMGIAMSLPIFDQKQGEIEAEKWHVSQHEKDKKETAKRLSNNLIKRYRELETLLFEYQVLKETMLPNASDVYQAIHRNYLRGKRSYLEVQDAQNSLFDMKEKETALQAKYYTLKAQLYQLVGLDLEQNNPYKQSKAKREGEKE